MTCFTNRFSGPWITFIVLVSSGHAHAELYQRVDPVTGHVTITNVPPAGVRQPPVSMTSDSVLPGRRPAGKSPAPPAQSRAATNFPRITAEQQRSRDTDRRQILTAELRVETAALAAAVGRKESADVLRRHKANIASLEREIAATK